MKKFLSFCIAVITGYACLIYFLGDSAKDILGNKISQDIMMRRNYLIRRLAQGPSASDFFKQSSLQYAGEWVLVTYSMSASALTNIAMAYPQTAKESSQAIAGWVNVCLSEKMQDFDINAWGEKPLDSRALLKDRGHFGYYSHLNLILGCYALLNNDGRFNKIHRIISDAVARRMLKYPHRHAETYPGETYPPDNIVAALSLRLADTTLGTDYEGIVVGWLKETKRIEGLCDGFSAFQLDSQSGKPLQSYRGSNVGWNSFFMPLIDEPYARRQFKRFKEKMLVRLPGLAAFREYPKGNFFRMDCDTGPVLFGLGGTATVFSVAGAKWAQDKFLLSDLLRTCELFGVTVTRGRERRYLFSPIVGEAVLLAMKTACPWRPLWIKSR